MGSSLAAREGRDSLDIESSVTLDECLCPEGLVIVTAPDAVRIMTEVLPPSTIELERLIEEPLLVMMFVVMGKQDSLESVIDAGDGRERLSRASV
jgi:hypothetical protein